MEDIMKCNIIDFCEIGMFSLLLGGLRTGTWDGEDESESEKTMMQDKITVQILHD